MKKNTTVFVTQSAVIAAIYIVLTLVSAVFGLDKGMIQLRISEAITFLPCYMFSAVPGLTLGCFFANLFCGSLPPDIIFGTVATLIGALGSYIIGRKNKYLSVIPPIISNSIIVPIVLKFAYNVDEAVPFLMLTVAIGEILSCGVLGIIIMRSLPNSLINKFNNGK